MHLWIVTLGAFFWLTVNWPECFILNVALLPLPWIYWAIRRRRDDLARRAGFDRTRRIRV